MDGTLGRAPRHAYDTKFASWLVSHSFAATTLRRLRGGPWKRRAFSCEKTQAPGKRPDLCVHVVITKLSVGCWMSKISQKENKERLIEMKL
jgi:hypothetical protein